ncbi:MAG: ABC transporter permease [Desulforhopalus sp.]
MNLFTISLKNMRRKPTKTLLLLLVFSLGVMSVVALYQVSLVVGHSLEQKLTAYGANIVIKPASEKLSVGYGGFHMGDMLLDISDLRETETTDAIRTIALHDRISVVAPKLVSMVKVGEVPIAVVGVRWQEELGIKSYWATDGTFPQQPDEVLLGSLAAKKLGLVTGDTLFLHGSEFRVSGTLYETGSDDDSVVLLDLGRLQELLGRPGAVSFVEVAALCSGCPIEDIVTQIQAKLPNTTVTALQSVVNQRMSSVRFVQRLALSVSLVILVTASAMVGLSMLSAVNERKKDIGILRSLGYGKSKVFMIFCLEAGLIGAVAGTIGYLAGFGASLKTLEVFSLTDVVAPDFSVVQLAMCMAIFPLIAMLSALYPSWKGASVEPSRALVSL